MFNRDAGQSALTAATQSSPSAGRVAPLNRAAAAVALVVAASLATACGPSASTAASASEPIRIGSAEIFGDHSQIVVGLHSCHAEGLDADIATDADTVRVLVTGIHTTEHLICGDTIVLQLDGPLGGREVLDESTGTTIPVDTFPWDAAQPYCSDCRTFEEG